EDRNQDHVELREYVARDRRRGRAEIGRRQRTDLRRRHADFGRAPLPDRPPADPPVRRAPGPRSQTDLGHEGWRSDEEHASPDPRAIRSEGRRRALLPLPRSVEDDDTWLYMPSRRRVRRLSTAQRSDALFGQDADIDSFYGYAGHIAWMNWRFLGEKQ